MRDDYYQLLGITSDATAKEVAQAFRKQSLKCHPDKVAASAGSHKGDGGGSAAAADEAFALVREAYAVLSDPSSRHKYDCRALWISSHPEQNRLAANRSARWTQSLAEAPAIERPSLAATMPIGRAGSWLRKGQSHVTSYGKVAPGPWLVISQDGSADQATSGGASGNRKPKGLRMSSSAGRLKLPLAGRQPHGSISMKPCASTRLTGLGNAVPCSVDSSAGMSCTSVQLWGASGLRPSAPRNLASRGGALLFGLTCPAGFSSQAVHQTTARPTRQILLCEA
eukprot:TRINITY_DN109287_c0_g1_i1.p1 TRINITY_DN109287_c0_g1~~TRINITY_DN109287_c0_g1_i1.p1  ORF type:complete len:282 (+),score=48.61 TRINITY_DN109287_c0_g1_i1:135-980(+)